jgi:hypothetical protein
MIVLGQKVNSINVLENSIYLFVIIVTQRVGYYCWNVRFYMGFAKKFH